MDDQCEFFKFFMRMKLMPSSDVVPCVLGHERERKLGVYGVVLLVELGVSFIFTDMGVAIVDSRKSRRELREVVPNIEIPKIPFLGFSIIGA